MLHQLLLSNVAQELTLDFRHEDAHVHCHRYHHSLGHHHCALRYELELVVLLGDKLKYHSHRGSQALIVAALLRTVPAWRPKSYDTDTNT